MNLIDGVNVLYSYVVDDAACCSYLGIALAVLGALCIIVGLYFLIKHNIFNMVPMVLGGLTFILLSIISFSVSKTFPYTVYKVTIDDTVSMNEFTERYEIKGQEGKIYKIIERSDQNSTQDKEDN